MWRASAKLMMAAVVTTWAMGMVGCANKSVRTYVAGWEATSEQSRAKLTELEQAGEVELVRDLETEEIIDYVVLPPVPGEEPAEQEGQEAQEVLDRMNWFAITGAHDEARLVAREREIPLVQLPQFLEMAEAGQLERRERPGFKLWDD